MSLTQLPTLIRNNWFKILVASLLLVLFFKKDFSIQFNVNSPELKNSPAKITPPTQKKEVYTDKKEASVSSPRQKLGLLLPSESVPSIDLEAELKTVEQTTQVAFLKRFARVAIAERKKFGIPSSIILANALLNSTAGSRSLTQKSNNHFALPCGNDWTNSTITDNGICYRKYENAWTSFRDHSAYITSGRFAELKSLHIEDYRGWARGLEKNGFSEDSDFDKKLIRIIEKYSLNELDTK